VPELALYVELFNSTQSRNILDVRWKSDLAAALRETKAMPALVVGRYLKSAGTRDRFQALDYLFGELTVNQSAFYPGLLALGSMEGRQLLLPVSFDIPAIVFMRGGESKISDDFLVGMEGMAQAAKLYNKKQGESYTRMGFSPRWNPDFLCLAAAAAGAGFKEGKPLAYSDSGLRSAVDELRAWTRDANGSPSLEDDFQFKYLYTPAYKYVAEGRALFAYLTSDEFFLVPEEKRSILDYRWFARNGLVPVDEGIVYAALPRAGRDKPKAEAFLTWFFQEDNQKAMLEKARTTRAIEGSFGIASGFSSIRSVNERVFPLYYPSLVGHLPPADSLAPPNVLPGDWPELKDKVVGPWLVEVTSHESGVSQDLGKKLEEQIAAHYKRKAATR